jgi:tetratricopeptide (TPR) repeat protein
MKRFHFLTIPVLVMMTWAVFWQVQRFEFVNFDDRIYSSQNPYILNGVTIEGISWAFSSASCEPSANWFPLTWLSLMVDGQLYRDYPGGFHLTSVLLHTANVLLLYVLLMQMTGDLPKSLFVAALFAVHPLNVETVVWISERKGLLSTFFGLISLCAYVRYAKFSRVKWYLIALVAFVLSLMSKQMLVTLPFVLLLLDYWPLGRIRNTKSEKEVIASGTDPVSKNPGMRICSPRSCSSLVWEKSPFFVIAIVFCFIAIEAQRRGGAVRTLEELSLTTRCSNAVVAYLLYIGKMFLPVKLSVFYPYPLDFFSVSKASGSAFLLISLSVVAAFQVRKRPYVSVGWLWYLGTLVPMIGLVQIGEQQMADRYTYIPMIGLFVAVTWLVPSLMRPGFRRRIVIPVCSVLLLAGLMRLSWVQTGHWQNSVSLFEHASDVTERNKLAHNNLGLALRDQGRFDEAIHHLKEALKIDPEYALAQNNLSLVLRLVGRLDESIHHSRLALTIQPDFAVACVNLGITLCMNGKQPEGVEQFRLALRTQPDNIRAHVSLAIVLSQLGELDEARKHADLARAIQKKTPYIRLPTQMQN